MNSRSSTGSNTSSSTGDTAQSAGGKDTSKQDYDKLVKEVADRVWQMWRDELRENNQRIGPKSRR